MLTEFAFTPSIFEESMYSDVDAWSAHLGKLGDKMFPQGYPWPVIVANLCAGGWKGESSRQIQRIGNRQIRTKAMSLFTQIERVLIERPMMLDWPEDQKGWCQEALRSAKDEPIERIVACRFAMDQNDPVTRAVRCISEVQGAGFWSGIPADDSPEMDIMNQVGVLRKLCVHAGFVSLVTPQINAGEDDESDFAVELIKSLRTRPAGYPGVMVELHTDGPRDSSPGDPVLATYANGIHKKLSRELGPGLQYTLTLWPKLLHRYVIAGDMTVDASGNPAKKTRWAISMNHIARKGDDKKNLLPADWKLLRNERVRSLGSQFCSTPMTGHLVSRPMTT